jgi:hypothetical protein
MAYDQTLFLDLKVVDAATVRQLALRKPDEHRVRLLGQLNSSRVSISTVSISSSCPSSSAIELNGTEEVEGVQISTSTTSPQVIVSSHNRVKLKLNC